jgi:ABC-2 type transport system permease protein
MGQSVPGMLAMFVVMTVLIGGSEAITKEKRLGTLRRLATTTLSRGQILGGKLGGLVLLGVVQAAILIVVTEVLGRTGVLGMDFVWGAGVLPLTPLLIAYAFCVGSIGLFISGLFRTAQQAESLSWLIGMVFAGLGGCWWPLEIVPRTLRTVGHFFPTAWAMDGLHEVITWGHGFAGVTTPTLVLLLYGALFAVLGARSMRVTD